MEFYAPWCGHCQQLSPKWKALAKSLKGVVKVGAVNCDVHKSLCSQHGISGFPTIKALTPRSSTWTNYQGQRSAKALSDWAISLIPSAISHLRNSADLATFLQRCGGASSSTAKGAKKAKGGASWGLCMVLVTDKADVPALYKGLSAAFANEVAFGMVRSSSEGLAKQLNTSTVPSVVSICNGDLSSLEVYSGKLKSGPLQTYLNTYRGGKQCNARIKLEASMDLMALNAKQLKDIIKAKGVDCSGCFEKADYVKALRSALQLDKQEL